MTHLPLLLYKIHLVLLITLCRNNNMFAEFNWERDGQIYICNVNFVLLILFYPKQHKIHMCSYEKKLKLHLSTKNKKSL